MSSIKATKLDGDLSVGRNLSIGGKATIQGNSHLKGGLKVDGWLEAPNVKGPNKGIFSSLEKLKAEYPFPRNGWYALVGTSLPAPMYVGDNGDWVATGGTGGNMTADVQQFHDDLEALEDSFTGELSELRSAIGNTDYVVCETSGNIQQKAVRIPGFNLSNKARFLVKMNDPNIAANAILRVDSDTTSYAKPLFYNGTRATTNNSWADGAILDIYYDGTNFQATDFSLSQVKNRTNSVGYVVCDTPAATAAKAIAVTGLTALTTGIRLLVKMTYNNTAKNATLNINSLGIKPLYYNNELVNGDNAWEAGEVVELYYDGMNFYSNNVQGGAGDGGNKILPWNTDLATTRKQVLAKDRKALLQISYRNGDGAVINEQYVGELFTDKEWEKNANWEKIPNQSEVDEIKEIAAEQIDSIDNDKITAGAFITEKGQISGRSNHAYSTNVFNIYDGFEIIKNEESPNADNLKCVVGFYDENDEFILQQDSESSEVTYNTRLYIGDIFNGKLAIPNNAKSVRLRKIYRSDSEGTILTLGDISGVFTVKSLKNVRQEIYDLSDRVNENTTKITENTEKIRTVENKTDSVRPIEVLSGVRTSGIGHYTKYLSVEIKVDNEISQVLVKGTKNQIYGPEDQPVGTWVRYSNIGTELAKASLSISFADGETHNIYYRKLVAFNDGEVFGAENPLSKTALDKLFENVPDSGNFYVDIYKGLTLPSDSILGKLDDTFVKTEDIGNVSISSAPNGAWEGWKEIGTYGQSKVASIPIYNKCHGAFECDAQLSVLPLWACWSQNASGQNNNNGGHILHGWTTDRKHRVTITQNIYRTDEASMFNYIPGDKAEGGEGVFLRFRLGCDNVDHGMLIEPIYPNGYSGGYWHRVSLIGRFAVQSNNVCPVPASSTDSGVKGEFTFDENYMYYCVADNQWKRIPLEDWA